MNCESVRKHLSLFLYGELSIEEEQELQDHMDGCEQCRKAFEAEKAVHQVLDGREMPLPPALLVRCRRDLDLRLSVAGRQRTGTWDRIRGLFEGGWVLSPAWVRPLGAVALVALGFFAARWTAAPGDPGAPATLASHTSTAEPVVSRVRYLRPEPSGKVRLVVEETRQRLLTGDPDEEPIRRLLLAAAREASDPGLRADSMELLRARTGSNDLRAALLHALREDPNPGVRLKALDALKPFASERDVRDALARALISDDNPGVRTQAIDLLVQNREDSVVGLLQELVQRDSDNYVRLRSQRALQEMNASIGTF